jgi:hypothetical protein
MDARRPSSSFLLAHRSAEKGPRQRQRRVLIVTNIASRLSIDREICYCCCWRRRKKGGAKNNRAAQNNDVFVKVDICHNCCEKNGAVIVWR